MALTDNIISYHSFDASNSTDNSGNGFTGTDSNITYSSGNGKLSNGAGFASASPSEISLGSSASFAPAAVTYNCWVKATSFPNGYNAVISKECTGKSLYVSFFVKSNGKIAAYISTPSSIFYDGTGSNTLSTGTWYMLTFTYDSTAGLVCYVNGSSDGTAAANGALNTSSSGLLMKIGSDYDYTDRYWNGAIDEVGIWSRALTSTEITTLYNGGTGYNPYAGSATNYRRKALLGVGQ